MKLIKSMGAKKALGVSLAVVAALGMTGTASAASGLHPRDLWDILATDPSPKPYVAPHVLADKADHPADQYCAMLAVKDAPDDDKDPLTVCGSDLNEASAKLKEIEPLAKTHLVSLYEDEKYGRANDQVYGDKGNCDKDGYRIKMTPWWQLNLSSVHGWNGCDKGRFTQRTATDHSRTMDLPAPGIGEFNDNTKYLRAHHG
ncbi:hypothetical protein [Crossiella cryophila]|uniref:Secreted protein n=1 Tax=Crossiella cryophila TaxID=43355 RepID=A0A7W7FWA5_9PSEU|nr:hypothetical protein [Crossiella cryophila]MBB4680062.1 hypothetical protein [Crossiella cryophila]